MTLSNQSVLVELENIRLRQIPWQKKPGIFKLLAQLGLVAGVRQRIISSARPPLVIAALTDTGKVELERLKDWSGRSEWAHMGRSEYPTAGSNEPVVASARRAPKPG